MATSTINLYIPTAQNWKLLPEKCFCVEDIESFLGTQTKITISNFQYIKNQLEVEIKVNLTERYSAPLNASGTGYNYPAIKYVSITNSDEVRTYYYFVKKIEWRSTMTCKLNLIMDVLNTIRYGVDYTLDKKCHITRQHKNRFVVANRRATFYCTYNAGSGVFPDQWDMDEDWKFSNSQIGDIWVHCRRLDYDRDEHTIEFDFDFEEEFNELTSGDTFVIYSHDLQNSLDCVLTDSIEIGEDVIRKIDLLSEGINAPLYTHSESSTQISGDNRDWYLIYKNRQDPTEAQEQSLINPVDCFVCTDESIKISYGSPLRRLLPANVKKGIEYYVSRDWWTGTIYFSDGTSWIMDNTAQTDITQGITIQVSGNKLYLSKVNQGTTLWQDDITTLKETSYINFSGTDVVQAREMNKIIDTYAGTSVFPMVALSLGASYVELDSIADIVRTDAKLIKIIKIPYCPVALTKIGDIYQIDFDKFIYDVDMNMLKVKDLNMKFNNRMSIAGVNPLHEIIMSNRPSPDNNRNDTFESKIYHSDFYTPKFVYDSFAFVFQLEKVNIYRYQTCCISTLYVLFTTTTTINSRFMFSFEQYKTSQGTQDYANVMPIARNNEIALYNVAYLNYIRSGFNYDVKAKQRTEATTWISTILSGIGTIASLVAPIGPLKIPTAVALGSSFAMSLTNSINTTLTQENNMQQKLEQLKMQSASVYGSDDVDLMSEYTNNKAKIVEYKVSDQMKSLLLDLFYYIGYNENITTTPNITSRYWFNYLACDPVFNWTLPNIPEELKDELINLYKSGITFLHHHAEAGSNTQWDFEQVKENAETNVEVIEIRD